MVISLKDLFYISSLGFACLLIDDLTFLSFTLELEEQLKCLIVLWWLVGRDRDRIVRHNCSPSSNQGPRAKAWDDEGLEVWSDCNWNSSVLPLPCIWVDNYWQSNEREHILKKPHVLHSLEIPHCYQHHPCQDRSQKQKQLGIIAKKVSGYKDLEEDEE